jgi:hypothetical protein
LGQEKFQQDSIALVVLPEQVQAAEAQQFKLLLFRILNFENHGKTSKTENHISSSFFVINCFDVSQKDVDQFS